MVQVSNFFVKNTNSNNWILPWWYKTDKKETSYIDALLIYTLLILPWYPLIWIFTRFWCPKEFWQFLSQKVNSLGPFLSLKYALDIHIFFSDQKYFFFQTMQFQSFIQTFQCSMILPTLRQLISYSNPKITQTNISKTVQPNKMKAVRSISNEQSFLDTSGLYCL